MTPPSKTFGYWLKAERERKNLTPSELARRAEVKPQYIYNLENDIPTRNGKLPQPSSEVCMRLARALGVHYLEALRAAGHIPEDIPESEVIARMAGDYVSALPEDKQEEALGYLKFLFDKFGDEGKMRERSPKHPAVVRDGEASPEPIAETMPQQDDEAIGSKKGVGKRAYSKRAAKNRGSKRR